MGVLSESTCPGNRLRPRSVRCVRESDGVSVGPTVGDLGGRSGVADGSGLADEQARDEQREVYSTLDLALRIGEVMLSSGAGTADATATILAVTAAGGLRGCEVDITSTSMAISYQAASDAAPETHLRVVQYRGQDYSRLTDVDQLVR